MCPAEECCSTERLSLSGVQQVRTTERRSRASSLRVIEIEERKGGLSLSQAIISLVNCVFVASENVAVHSVHTLYVLYHMSASAVTCNPVSEVRTAGLVCGAVQQHLQPPDSKAKLLESRECPHRAGGSLNSVCTLCCRAWTGLIAINI